MLTERDQAAYDILTHVLPPQLEQSAIRFAMLLIDNGDPGGARRILEISQEIKHDRAA